MEFNQMELLRETMFKDSVLSAAESKRMEIIGKAQRSAADQLAQMQKSCSQVDKEMIEARYARQSEREYSGQMLEARAQLLKRRAQLVDDIFEQAQQRVVAFTQQDGYRVWLLARLEHYRDFAAEGSVTVMLRKQDLPLEEDIAKQLPGCTVTADASIRFGGAKISNGRHLYNETLDNRLAAERQAFYKTSGLQLD